MNLFGYLTPFEDIYSYLMMIDWVLSEGKNKCIGLEYWFNICCLIRGVSALSFIVVKHCPLNYNEPTFNDTMFSLSPKFMTSAVAPDGFLTVSELDKHLPGEMLQ